MTAQHDDPGIASDDERPSPDETYAPCSFDDPQARKPTAKQLVYLRVLADRTGQTFAYPRTQAQASREIRRLKAVHSSSRQERAIERADLASENAARAANRAVPINLDAETRGYGSTATWSRRS